MTGFDIYSLTVPTRTVHARIVATADSTRKRIERDLHDGAQQQLIALALELRAAQAAVPPELSALRAELSSVIDGLSSVLDELREIARGIHPGVLAERTRTGAQDPRAPFADPRQASRTGRGAAAGARRGRSVLHR